MNTTTALSAYQQLVTSLLEAQLSLNVELVPDDTIDLGQQQLDLMAYQRFQERIERAEQQLVEQLGDALLAEQELFRRCYNCLEAVERCSCPAELLNCSSCGVYVTDVRPGGFEDASGQRWCAEHAPKGQR